MPKLRRLPFETAIIQRYRRKEVSVEEALVEMYLAGVSVRRVDSLEKREVSRRSCGDRRDVSYFICMMLRSLAICEFRRVIDLNHSRANGEGFIRSESMINRESYFAGKEAMRQKLRQEKFSVRLWM
jgi:hypothetical protein